jgi:hypothetical protein
LGKEYYTLCIKSNPAGNRVGWLMGVDVGGTFTDFCAYDTGTRTARQFEIPSIPRNPEGRDHRRPGADVP